MPSFEIHGTWFVLLRGDDDEVLLRSTALRTKREGEDVENRIRDVAGAGDRFERHAGTDGGHYFVLRDVTGDVLARSPTFESAIACEQAMAKVQQLLRPTR